MARLSKKQMQTIATLERRVAMCQEFMNDWLLFNQIMNAYPSPGVNKAQLENQFLKIKSKLAREHRVLKDTLGADYNLDANTMNLVSQSTSLESIYGQSDVAIKKLQTEWHRCFISINETLGALIDKKQRAEAGEKIYIATTIGAEGPMKASASTETVLWVVGTIVVVGVVIGVAAVTGMLQAWWDMVSQLFR
ncbi:MAG: hypothetical protein KA184_17075 [Candidatus Hydrogenedentes bacterium]|nr:hypothetical protein [Candidatus Hydrogenedentota bacterium]